jgi:twitching motility two-component system response regulator PilH
VDFWKFFKRLFGAGAPTEASGRRGKPRLNARGGMRVLVVDDSATVVALLGRMLRQNGYVVLEAADAEQGTAIAKAEQPDLVFLDIVLPGMSGFSALRLLRRQPETRGIPIIMMSGNEQATEQFYAQRIGADDFMKKPFSRAEVFSRIENLLDVSLLPRRHGLPVATPAEEPSAQESGSLP